MRTLYLMRHAKSSWHDPTLEDYDRPLNPRGLRAAPLVGAHMEACGYRPDVILCSSARRTLETLSLIKPYVGLTVPTHIEDGLYLADAGTLIGRVQEITGGHVAALVIGHNAGLEDCLTLLADPQASETAVPAAMPTASLAALTFTVDDWAGVAEGTGRLTDFTTPAMLSGG